MAGVAGAGATFAAGLNIAGQIGGPAAPYLVAASAVAAFATYLKDSRNAFIEFQKNLSSKNLQLAISNLEQMFSDLGKDITDIDIANNITREIRTGLSEGKNINNLDATSPKAFYANLLDSSQTTQATDRSKILEKYGTAAYVNSYMSSQTRDAYARQLAPERAQGYAKEFSDTSNYAQRYIENQVSTGSSYEDLRNSGDFQLLSESIALANNRVQEQIMEIDRSTIANKEAAKAAVIRAYGDEQIYKITKNSERQRLSESADRDAKKFSMSFDRLINNMTQSIDSTNFTLAKFNDQLEASTASLSGQAEIRSTRLDAINVLKNPNMSSDREFRSAASSGSSLFGTEKGIINTILNLGKELEPSIMETINKTIKDNPGGVSDTKISMAIDRNVSSKLAGTGLPKNLSDQLSQQIGDAVEQIRKKEGSGSKDKRIDFAELINAIPALKDTFDALKSASNAVVGALENQQKALDDYNQKINESIKYQIESSARRNKADEIVLNGSLELSRAFGESVDPIMGIRLRDQKTARITGGPTSASDILDNINGLEARRRNQQAGLDALKNRSIGQPGSTQAIIDNERALSKTNYQINQTAGALKNLADNSEAASVAMSALQSAQQKQAGKLSLLEKVIGSTPEELYSFNNALVRLQKTAAGQQMFQTADQRKEVMSVMNDILPLIGNNQQANNLKADVFENLLRDSGVGVNPQFAEIINSIRNPEADPAIKLAADAFRKATEQQGNYNRALATLSQDIGKEIVSSSAELLTKALNDTRVKFDEKQIQDIVNGIRDPSTVMRPAEPQMKAAGGVIYAAGGDYVNFQSRGTDTVPAMLTPGEFVMKKSAVDSIGVNNLSRMNNGYQNGGQVRYYADGGYVTDSLKPEYKDNTGGSLKVKKSGKFSTAGEYPQIDNLDELQNTLEPYVTFQNMQKIKDFSGYGSSTASLSIEKGPSTKNYNPKSFLGFGYPVSSSAIASGLEDFNHTVLSKSYVSPPDIKPNTVGLFISGRSEAVESLKTRKKLEFDGPEAEAQKQLEKYIDRIERIKNANAVPQDLQIDSNSYKLQTQGINYDILPLNSRLTTSNPATVKSEGYGTRKFSRINFSNLSQTIDKDVGLLSPNSGGAATLSQYLTSQKEKAPDFSLKGKSIRPEIYGGKISDKSFFSNYITKEGLGAITEPQSSRDNLLELQNITNNLNNADKAIRLEKLRSTDSDRQMDQELTVLRKLYQGSVVSASIEDKLFDLSSLGATKNNIEVFSTSISEWNSKYLEAIKDSIKGDARYNDLSYYGKSPKSFDILPEAGGDVRKLPWVDAGIPIREDVRGALQREVENNTSLVTPNVVSDPRSGLIKIPKNGILSQDLSLPYEIDFSKYVNKFWNSDTDTLSDEDILGGKPAYLVNQSGADNNPFKGLLLNNKRLFSTDAGRTEETLQKQIAGFISSDNGILTYLNSVITDGYDSDKAKKLEKSSLDKFFTLSSVADKVGFLTNASSVGAQGGELFSKTPNIFGDSTSLSFRDYLISRAKELTKENNDTKNKENKQKFGDKPGDGFLDPLEYPGASLAMILGAQDLFGSGSQYELPKLLGKNWFRPTLNRRFNDIFEVPNEMIKSYMGGLATIFNDKAGIIDTNARYFADKDPATYDRMMQAYTYLDGARQAFDALSVGDTGSINLKSYLTDAVLKAPRDPSSYQAAEQMFLSLGMNGKSSYVNKALERSNLSPDEQKSFAKTMEGSKIDQSTIDGDIDLQDFKTEDLGKTYESIYGLALNPYNQYTNRNIRKLLLDQFISRIPTASKPDGTPLFTPTTGRLFDQALRTMRYWYGGEEGIVIPPLRNWPGTDYLYDNSIVDPNTQEALSFNQKLEELMANNDPMLYDNARLAYDHVGGKQRFGELPSVETYANYNPEIVEAQKRQTGGLIYASAGSFIDFSPKGTDTVPAMLTPGEFVVNAKATSEHLPLLKAINSGSRSSSRGFQKGGVAYLKYGDHVQSGRQSKNVVDVRNQGDNANRQWYQSAGEIGQFLAYFPQMLTEEIFSSSNKHTSAVESFGKRLEAAQVQEKSRGGLIYLAEGSRTPVPTLSLTSSKTPELLTTGVNGPEPLKPVGPLIMSDNPLLAGVGGAGKSLEDLSYGIYGASKVAGAGVLAVPGIYAAAKNEALTAVGIRDQKTYDQVSAEIGGYMDSLGKSAYAGASDTGNYLLTASGQNDLTESTYATATQDKKDVEAVTGEFGSTAGTALSAAQNAAFISTNILAGEKGLDPVENILKGVGNAPQLFREGRATTGQLLAKMGAPELGANLAMNAADTTLATDRLLATGADAAHGTKGGWWNAEDAAIRAGGDPGVLPKTTFPGQTRSTIALSAEAAGGDLSRVAQSAEGVTVAGGLGDKAYFTHIGEGALDPRGAAESAINYAKEGLMKGGSLDQAAVIVNDIKQSALTEALATRPFDPSSTAAMDGVSNAAKSLGLDLGETAGKTPAQLQNELIKIHQAEAGITRDVAARRVGELMPEGVSSLSSQIELREGVTGTTLALNPATALEHPLGTPMSLAELTRRPELINHGTVHRIDQALDAHGAADRVLGAIYPEEEKPQNRATGGLIYANNGALIAKGKDRIPAMLSDGEFVVNADSAKKNMPLLEGINNGAISYASNGALIGTQNQNIDTRLSPSQQNVMGAINTGYYSRGGVVGYLNNGGYVRASYLENGGMAAQNAVNRPGDTAVQTGVLNSVGQNMVMEKPAWVDEFISQTNSAFQGLSETMSTSATKFAETGKNMLNSAESFSSSANKISDISLPETISMNGNFDFSQQSIKNIIGRSVGESVAINTNNTNSSISDNNAKMRSSLNNATDGGLDISGLA